MNTPAVAQLYRDQVLRHAREPSHRRHVDDATFVTTGDNPLCGDKLTVYLTLDGQTIEDVSFEGSACAIGIASASMMSTMLSGSDQNEARQVIDATLHWLRAPKDTAPTAALADTPVSALAAVREYPSRVKCATLAWHAAANATRHLSTTVTTE